MTEKIRDYGGIDAFRLIAAVLIIAIHTSPLAGLNETSDFILTRVIARIAVPFFFMTSGFFLFYKTDGGTISIMQFMKKTAIIYGISIVLYLPLNFYAGTTKEWSNPAVLFKDIVFNGTFYHLWYLPASILGVFLIWVLLKKLKTGQVLLITFMLYSIGVFGDSYYGIANQIPAIKTVYQGLFYVSDYTRNGLFFAPFFLLMGILLARQTKKPKCQINVLGFVLSTALMFTEGLILHAYNLQRHDSMYFMLIPCMFFLFQLLLSWNVKSKELLRKISLLVYLIHPAIIVLVRGLAKVIGLQKLLIENSAVHFLAVAFSSVCASTILVMLYDHMKLLRVSVSCLEPRAWIEINLAHLEHNIKAIRQTLPEKCEIMAVVKADAYGHGIHAVIKCLEKNNISSYAVATLEEAVQLRKYGVKGEILILGYTPCVNVPILNKFNLTQTVIDAKYANELDCFGKLIQIHIKVNTGMNRLGENCHHTDEIASIFDCKNLKIKGIYTHLCVSDRINESDTEFTYGQINRYYELLDGLKEKGLAIPKTHIQSSYGILNYPELHCDYARIGIALYGVLSMPGEVRCPLDLQAVLSLKSKVALVRTVLSGESVGYGRSFTAEHDMKIAVISIGYADGYPRNLSGTGHVLIRGKKVSIVGRICMDQLTVDVTEAPEICRGDIVTLIGRDDADIITAEEVATSSETITNEILCRLGHRLKKIVCSN